MAFSVGSIEVNVEQNFAPLHNVESKTSPTRPLADWQRFACTHLLQQSYWNVHDLVIDFPIAPNGAQHQNSLVTLQVRECVLNQRVRYLLASFSGAELGDANSVSASYPPSLGF
ncbi:MAG TPA: hypothetical protein VGJ26_13830 [Pirellulales bacterium]